MLRVFVVLLVAHLVDCETNKQPNIIFLVFDDLGWNDVSFHGSNQIPTPNIDALAYSGVILNRHYVLPTCTPSRTALLTGMNTIRTGMQGYPLKAGEPRNVPLTFPLLPERLKKLNYSTHLLGKWHVGFMSDDYTPSHRGFDSFFGYYNGLIEYKKHGCQQTRRDGETLYGYDLHFNDDHYIHRQYDGQYFTRMVTERAVGIIQQHNQDTPLYLQVSHLAVHTGTDFADGLEVPDDVNVNITFPHINDYSRRQFAGMITELDKSVGQVVQTLKQTGMLDNSLIVMISDNGGHTLSTDMLPNWASNYPLRGTKFTMYEGGVRGVAAVWSPLLPAGIVSESFVHITDWVPTLYTAAGGSAVDIVTDGHDMWENIRTMSSTNRSFLLNIDEVEGAEGVIIDSRWKVIQKGMGRYGAYDYHAGQLNGTLDNYDTDLVRNSLAGTALRSIPKYETFLEPQGMEIRRLEVTVQCGEGCDRSRTQFGYVKPSLDFYSPSYRAFDLLEDPCECRPLEDADEILERGKQLISDYWKGLKPQTNTLVDAESDPKLWDGVWRPWRDAGGSGSHQGSLLYLLILVTIIHLLRR